MRSEIRSLITHAVDVLLQERSIDTGGMPRWALERTKQKGHGDFASNVALVLAKSLGSKPRDLAQAVLERLPAAVWITRAEIAGPGFINFYLSPAAYYRVIDDVREAQSNYGCCHIGKGHRVLVEFVFFLCLSYLIFVLVIICWLYCLAIVYSVDNDRCFIRFIVDGFAVFQPLKVIFVWTWDFATLSVR